MRNPIGLYDENEIRTLYKEIEDSFENHNVKRKPKETMLSITHYGDSKIQTIKTLRTYFGLGLKEAMGVSDGTPYIFNLTAEKIITLKYELDKLGCKFDMK